MRRIWWGMAAWAVLHGAAAADCAGPGGHGGHSARSPAYSVALVELFTSEGCSSCPPADRFLGGFSGGHAVLLALHVDYWNYIGWKDPFARAAFTERQRYLADLADTRTIYTPAFFVGGSELRNWPAKTLDAVKRINARPAQANIHIVLGAAAGGLLPVSVGAGAGQGATLYVALVQNGIVSHVKAGENNGRVLRHDYVVREWLAPVELRSDGTATLQRTVALPPGAQAGQLSVAAFVQSARGEVLQALSLPVCGK